MTWKLKRLVGLLLLLSIGSAFAETPIRVLVFSGQNNHNWQATTPALEKILTKSGRFTVDVTEHPEQCTADTFAKYDVILSNWNTFGKPAVTSWPDGTRTAFLDFIRGGKGFVVMHAGGSSFYDWPEYQQIAGASWKLGQTNHGAPHEFTVKPVADHPIASGLGPFTTKDELWVKPGVAPGATVLATGDDQPVALATGLGKGRGFALLLGHDENTMANAGFQALLLRGTEWAATGKVVAPDAGDLLKAVAAYKFAHKRDDIEELGKQIYRDPALAKKLAALLDSNATLEAKQYACRYLSIIGTPAEVPVLAKKLTDRDLWFYAIFALERIPGEASESAMRAALPTATSELRNGLINSLAARQDERAVPLIAKFLPDPVALNALGLIGGTEAAAALLPVDTAGGALLRAAHTLPAKEAAPIFEKLYAADQPAHIRRAAFMGRVAALGANGDDLILSGLTGTDKALQAGAVRALWNTQNPQLLGRVAAGLKSLSPDLQADVIAVLGERGDPVALPAVSAAVLSADLHVQRSAVEALGPLGNASSVSVLAGLLEGDNAELRKLAGESLGRLRGKGIDEAIAAAFVKAAPAAHRMLIEAVVARGAKTATPALLAAAQSSDAGLRQTGITGLGKLADLSDGPRVIALLDNATDADRPALESALAAIYRRAKDSSPVAKAVASATGAKKVSLLAVLGELGGPEALAALRSALQGDDPAARTVAVRALAEWNDAGPLDNLVTVATTTTDATQQVLALRGVARLVPMATSRPTAQLKELLRRALAAAKRPEEQQMLTDVLTTLSQPRNLARGATATNLDKLQPDHDGRGPETAIDGDPKTYWDETDDQKLYWIRVQLPEPATVAAIRITGWAQQNYSPKDFDVLCDGKAVKTITNAQYQNNRLTITLPATQCGSVELKITGYYGRSPAIRELEIYGPDGDQGPAGATGESAMKWEQTDTSLALLHNGTALWKLTYDKKEGKPYFHPLALMDGTVLTALRPADHPWHRALWWSWKFIDKLNYWEEDKKTGLSQGLTDLVKVKATPNRDFSAKIEMELSYHPPDKPPVMTEKRVLTISAPDAKGNYNIDWTATFTAGACDLNLDRTPPHGFAGGYAGLSCRLAAETKGWTYTSSEGVTGSKNIYGKTARWLDYSKGGGLAIFDHPKNFRHPTPWYPNEMPFFSPAFLFHEAWTMKANSTLPLRYRVLVHSESTDKEALEKQWKEFAK